MAINENQAKSFIKLFDILAPSQTYEHPNLDECLPVVLWPNQKVTLEYTGGRGVKKIPLFCFIKKEMEGWVKISLLCSCFQTIGSISWVNENVSLSPSGQFFWKVSLSEKCKFSFVFYFPHKLQGWYKRLTFYGEENLYTHSNPFFI